MPFIPDTASLTTLGWLALHCHLQGLHSVQGRDQLSRQSLRFVLGILTTDLLMSVRPALFEGLRSGGLDHGSRLLMHVENYGVPSWLDGAQHLQMHLKITVEGSKFAMAAGALARGATVALQQPASKSWRVLGGPAEHPFCQNVDRPD